VIVVSVPKHNKAEDLLVALITSEVSKARRRGEYVLRRWREVRLREESAIRPRLYQIIKRDVLALLGKIHEDDRPGMIETLKDLFGIT